MTAFYKGFMDITIAYGNIYKYDEGNKIEFNSKPELGIFPLIIIEVGIAGQNKHAQAISYGINSFYQLQKFRQVLLVLDLVYYPNTKMLKYNLYGVKK